MAANEEAIINAVKDYVAFEDPTSRAIRANLMNTDNAVREAATNEILRAANGVKKWENDANKILNPIKKEHDSIVKIGNNLSSQWEKIKNSLNIPSDFNTRDFNLGPLAMRKTAPIYAKAYESLIKANPGKEKMINKILDKSQKIIDKEAKSFQKLNEESAKFAATHPRPVLDMTPILKATKK
jgi:hypothetical protein